MVTVSPGRSLRLVAFSQARPVCCERPQSQLPSGVFLHATRQGSGRWLPV